MNFKTNHIYILSLLLISSLLMACASTPYNRLKTPAISGRITLNNETAHGLPVYLSVKGDDRLCFKAIAESTTDNRGEFHFHAIKEQLPRPPVMKHYLDEWNVCAHYNEQHINLYSGNRYGTGSINESINLKCELTKTTSSGYCSVTH